MEVAAQENVCSPNDTVLIAEIVAQGVKQPSPLLYILHELQEKTESISEEAISQISEALKIPMPEILALITFHPQFKLGFGDVAGPKARNVIRICSGAPCYANGAQTVIESISEMLEIQSGEATEDGRYVLEVVDCLGACGMSPVMMINDDIHGGLTSEQLPDILNKYA